MKRAGLERLAGLAEARRVRDLAQLEALAAERARLQAEIAELSGLPRRDAAEAALPFPMLAPREAWALGQIALRERRILALDQEMAAARAVARTSLAKHEALKTLTARAREDEEAVRARAEERAAAAPRPAARRPGP